jgi:hypothetical protein
MRKDGGVSDETEPTDTDNGAISDQPQSSGHDGGPTADQVEVRAPAAQPPEPPERERRVWNAVKADYGRLPRWAAAFVVLLGCSWGLLDSRFSVCDVETKSEKAEITVTQTCDQPSVSDAGVVAVALLIILLLAPDMSEIGVFGVSIKRRLEATEAKASESEAEVGRLETRLLIQSSRIESLSQNLASASAQATGNTVLIGEEFLQKISADLPRKAEAFKQGAEREPSITAEQLANVVAAPDPALATRLIRNWELLARAIDFGRYRPASRWDASTINVSEEDARRFANVFADELQIVQAARNNVAHARPITDEDLQAAVEISDRLLVILLNDTRPPGSS